VSVSVVDHDAVARFFGLDESATPWLRQLAAEPAPPPAPLPDGEELAELFRRIGGNEEELAGLQEMRPKIEAPAARWLLDRCVAELAATTGNGSVELLRWPFLSTEPGTFGRYFFAFVFLGSIPALREYHQQRGISDEVSWASMSDLPQQLAVHRRIFGGGGLHTQTWLTLPFRGLLFQLGRLQFNLDLIDYDQSAIDSAGAPFRSGEPVIGVHIPERGPLDPAACDESLRWAAEFFPRHFPERECRYATCHSWLLDPQLAEYLRPESNVVKFQQRFTPIPGGKDDDAAVFEFVFRTMKADLDSLPQNTTLERAVVQHIRGGGHWRVVPGWLELAKV
jgi:GNAT domain-containint protein/N-acyltransferase family protein